MSLAEDLDFDLRAETDSDSDDELLNAMFNKFVEKEKRTDED